MAGARETPRQKMIGMMYLVMTALLALNVSKDVINAFVVVDENIILSNENFEKKLKDIYENFEINYLVNQQKVKPFWEKAQIAKKLSNEMVNYILNIRYEIISKTEDVPIELAKFIATKDIKKKDENNITTNYFIGNRDNGSNGVACQLKNKIIEYRQEMLKLIDSKDSAIVNLGLETDGPYYDADGKEQNWELHFFDNTVIAAVMSILSKIVLDVYNAEFEVVNLLHRSIGQGDFKFERIEAKIVPKSNFVFIGDEYDAEIIVAAYDTSQSPDVYYSQNIDYLQTAQYKEAIKLDNKAGKININFPARSEGIKKYAGFVRTKSNTGFVKDYHFESEYIVAKPSYTISAKKMNVLYIGVDNPVSILMSGIPNESLAASISCGTIKRDPKNGDWLVNIPPGHKSAIINISATINSVKKNMGSKKFRVKNLPDPVATIGGKSSGLINRKIMTADGVLSPKMPDDFDFDHSFVIKSFTMTIQRGFKVYNLKSKDAYLTKEMLAEIKRTNRGQNIVFENIVVRDPYNIDRILSPIVLTIN